MRCKSRWGWLHHFLCEPKVYIVVLLLLAIAAVVTLDLRLHGCAALLVKKSGSAFLFSRPDRLSMLGQLQTLNFKNSLTAWSTAPHNCTVNCSTLSSVSLAAADTSNTAKLRPAVTPSSGLLDLQCYVINLVRNSRRLQTFMEEFEASDLGSLGCLRQRAVDGRRMDRGKLWSVLTHQAWVEVEQASFWRFRLKHYQLTPGGVGCYLSHLSVWRKYIQSSPSSHLLVFEDDAHVTPDLLSTMQHMLTNGSIPADYDVVLLGCICNNCTDMGSYRRVHHFWGTHSYLMRRRAVQKLLDPATYQGTNLPGLTPIAQQIDAVMVDLARVGRINIYAASRDLTVTRKSTSDIQNADVKRWWGIDAFAPVQASLPVVSA